MEKNFRISVHKNGENLHLKLIGDFNETAAHKLLNALKMYRGRPVRIFLHTGSLNQIHPFGLNIFHSNLQILNERCITLVFTGEHASKLAPEKTSGIDYNITTISMSRSEQPILTMPIYRKEIVVEKV
ncbi:MAG TPA: hypothetical protein VMW42_13255 [Desulfatiglandales bacterium]|nr:hypothetical protein [Desulfatiglandales bacterium]